MANEKDYEWAEASNLSKVKIGGVQYNLKDAEARQVIDSEASKLATEISARASADTALGGRIDTEISDRTAAVASVASDLAAEVSRATGVESDHDTRIRNLEARGRYLSTWNVTTGLPGDYPTIPEGASSPYTYTFKAGDYYIVNNVPASGTKYMPDGASITATKSGETWTWEVGKKETTDSISVGDQYVYSTSSWTHIAAAKDVAWGNITGELSKQTDLQGALDTLDAKISEKSTVTVSATGTATDQVSYITIDGVEKKLSDVDKAYVDAELSKKVDKEEGKSLMSTEEHNKLAGIASGAQVNVIETIKVGGTALEVSSKAVDIEVQEAGSLALKDVASFADLDATLQSTISNKVDKEDGKRLMTDAEGSKLAGIEAGAQVNIIEKIRINGSDVAVGSEKRIDLGNIAVTSAVVGNVSYVEADHKLQQTKGSVTTDVHAFGALADKSSASGTVSIGTVSGVQATGTSTGEISVQLDQTATAIQSTGSVVAKGSIAVSLSDNAASKLKTSGSVATFTEGAFTPASISEGFLTGGSVASYSHDGFSGGSLSAAATAQFASEGIKAHVGASAGEDKECLYFEDANKSTAVTAQGSFTAAVYGSDHFTANTLQSIDTSKFSGGSKASDTFDGGAMPTFDAVTVSVASATFTGSSVDISVQGSYDKATVNSSGTKFTGKAITLAVGDIVIGDKNVTVQ